MQLIGVDVGGTFTDLVYTNTDDNRTLIHKVPSTPADLSVAVLQGIREICEHAGIPLTQVSHIYHGTTVATNAALQHSGAKAGMITTKGFRDIIHIGRHQRPEHYSIQQDIPWQSRPLVKRRHRKVVAERLIPPSGEVDTPLDVAQVRTAAAELAAEGVEAIAICFLFAYLNPVHEQQAKAIVAAECPDIFVTCSSEVAPQFREFERFTTAAMNAFVGPLVRSYVARLADTLEQQGFQGEVHIMRSNGGVASAATIAQLPVYTLMSGLAAGVLGAAWIGTLTGRDNLISLDIGGTSADIGVVTNGRFREASARDTQVAGYPILVPMLDLHTIGAGGGSIAHIDDGGGFRVGPQSAGAVPGPAAYGLGGQDATVTDANIVLGRLDANSFLGGEMQLDTAAAEAAVNRLAKKLGLTTEAAAEGITALLNANMANAIRARTVQKGIDPRDYALVASGGAGPLHGVEVARLLDIPQVIVPPHPGINSAKGLLTTDLVYEVVRTSFLNIDNLDFAIFNNIFADMQTELESQLQREQIDLAAAQFARAADARYVGQGYELHLPIPLEAVSTANLASVVAQFHALHQQEYGHHFAQSALEFVNLRITATAAVPKIGQPTAPGEGSLDKALIRTAATLFRDNRGLSKFATRFFDRACLPTAEAIPGPAIIMQKDSTVVVPPDCDAQLDKTGSILITLGVREINTEQSS